MRNGTREGAAGHQVNVCPLLKRRVSTDPEMIQVPRETLEAMAEALSLAVACDCRIFAGPVPVEENAEVVAKAIQERRGIYLEIQTEAEKRAHALFGNCLPLNFIHALSLEIKERGTL